MHGRLRSEDALGQRVHGLDTLTGLVERRVIGERATVRTFQPIEERAQDRQRFVRRALLGETIMGSAGGCGVVSLQGLDDVVAQHHIVAVLEDVELHLRFP